MQTWELKNLDLVPDNFSQHPQLFFIPIGWKRNLAFLAFYVEHALFRPMGTDGKNHAAGKTGQKNKMENTDGKKLKNLYYSG